MENIQIVTVFNDKSSYDRNIAENDNMNCHELISYDNTRKNIPITRRYNDFINTRLKSDCWVIFCHQDFSFLHDPINVLKTIGKDCIYGVTGTLLNISPAAKFFKKILHFNNWSIYGQILQGKKSGKLFKHGIYLREPKQVNTVDCCCIIIHGELIKKYGLLFDERLDFHLYSEDLSMGAMTKHGIATKVLQFKCRHLSEGDYSNAFNKSAKYLRAKYSEIEFSSTAHDFSF